MDSFCEQLFGSLENETRRRVNNAVFISKEQFSTDSEDEDCDTYSTSSTMTNGTLKGPAILFGDGYNSDTSTSTTTVAKITPKKRRDYDPEAHKNWLKTKNEAERKRREKEQARKKREEMKKKLEEEKRKEQSEQRWKQWLERKKQEAEAKTQKQKSKSQQKVQSSSSKAWVPNDESISNFKVWLSRVNQQEEKTKLRSHAQQRLEGQLKQQRQDLSRTIYDEWSRSSISKPKPVPMNRGIESLRGTMSELFVNPQPWKSNLD